MTATDVGYLGCSCVEHDGTGEGLAFQQIGSLCEAVAYKRQNHVGKHACLPKLLQRPKLGCGLLPWQHLNVESGLRKLVQTRCQKVSFF